MTSEPTAPRPIAVLTAYRAPTELVERVRQLGTQVAAVVIVDDGSHSLSALDLPERGVVTVDLERNSGIAAALNRGIEQARELGATHIVTLDQDSALSPTYVAEAIELLDDLSAAGARPAAVVPERFGAHGVASTHSPVLADDPIQSGQVIPIEVFDAIGGFDERLFIDAVDTEFVMRARAAGFDFWILPGSWLDHAIGEQVAVEFFGRELRIFGRTRQHFYHAPFRTYYTVRNGLALWHLHRRGNTAWLMKRTRGLVWTTCLAVALAPDRWRQLVAAAHGASHGLRLRLGPIPARTLRAITPRG